MNWQEPNPFRSLSPQDFLAFGLEDLAYVREMKGETGAKIYGIFAADGTRMAVMTDRLVAMAAIRQNGLAPLSVH